MVLIVLSFRNNNKKTHNNFSVSRYWGWLKLQVFFPVELFFSLTFSCVSMNFGVCARFFSHSHRANQQTEQSLWSLFSPVVCVHVRCSWDFAVGFYFPWSLFALLYSYFHFFPLFIHRFYLFLSQTHTEYTFIHDGLHRISFILPLFPSRCIKFPKNINFILYSVWF